MQFIDTHTHIYTEEFDADRDEVVARARAAGARRLVLPNINGESIEPMLALCRRYPDLCVPAIGLHPEDIPEDPLPLLEEMEQLLALHNGADAASTDGESRPRFAAIGEVGIDLYWDDSRLAEQVRVFRHQVLWASFYRLPLIIHTRAAHRQLCDALADFRGAMPAGGIFHCFGGTEEEARELLGFEGFYLGIGGVVTFKKSTLPAVLAAAVPLERIVLETDAPYLAPVPMRGKRNEPAHIPFVIAKLADVYGVAPEDVARITTANAERLFSL